MSSEPTEERGVETAADGSVTDAAARLRTAAARVETLQVEEGSYCVVCRETGVRPAPVTGYRFDSYDDAEAACAAARAYRAALRALDPTLREYDLGVASASERSLQVASVREVVDRRRRHGLPRAESTATLAGDGYDEWLRVENAPVVHLAGPESLLDDELVSRQLDSKL